MKLSSPIYQLKRRARSLAREKGVPLHEAQDRVARSEGFASWSLLAATAAKSRGASLLDQAENGDLVLLAARPGQGKTLLGLKALIDARQAGRRAILFTLAMTEKEARCRLAELSNPDLADSIEVETSDFIDDYAISKAMISTSPGTVVVIDYLQLLGERRDKPPLAQQVLNLHQITTSRNAIVIMLSQVDRSFDPAQGKTPSIADVRRPNPLPVELFNKRLFLHAGMTTFESIRL